MKKYGRYLALPACFALTLFPFARANAAYHFSDFKATPPIHLIGSPSFRPAGFTPTMIKKAYGLPSSGGNGTVVIIGAYDDSTIESDLAVFDTEFHLAECTKENGCLEIHPMSASMKKNSGWAMEIALDVEWAHAIAPNAKILLVEATTPSGKNLLKAITYAASRKDAVAISMSWGGAEFAEEISLDSAFNSVSGAPFFASSGDNGTGASWPASSPSVIGVGGTTLILNADNSVKKETAWNGSGGGISAYESQPSFQKNIAISNAKGMRAIPDVSYDADPSSGFPVYRGSWRLVGGTSAGAPQWAALAALGSGVTLEKLYADKAADTSHTYFRDIVSGQNGDCTYYCDARARYDFITGLGSPKTSIF